MLYELCPKLRKWDFDGWVCHRVWVAHLLHKQSKPPADNAGSSVTAAEPAAGVNTEGNMPRGTYITDEQKELIIKDLRAGVNLKTVAAKYGVGYSTAARIGQEYKKRAAEAEAAESAPAEEQGGFVFAEGMTKEQRAQYTADVIAEVEGKAVAPDQPGAVPVPEMIPDIGYEERCENAAETAVISPQSSATQDDPGPDRLTVKQLIKLHWTDDILYFYEDEPGVKDGMWDFSGTELFLAYHSSVWVESMLRPEVLERTVCRIYNDGGVIRVLLD